MSKPAQCLAQNNLLFSAADFNQDCRQVVSTNSFALLDIVGTAGVDEGFDPLLYGLYRALSSVKALIIDEFVDVGDGLLRSHHVPHPVTCQEHELGVVADGLNLDIGEASHSLLLHGELKIAFVFEVAKGP